MRILVIENDEGFGKQWVELLRSFKNEVLWLTNLAVHTAHDLHGQAFDLALVDRRACNDYDQFDASGEELAVGLCKLGTQAVLVTAFVPPETALFNLLRTGALTGVADKSLDMLELAMCVEEFKVRRRFPNCLARFEWKDGGGEAFGTVDWRQVLKSTGGLHVPFEEFAVLFRSLISPSARTVKLKTITPGHGGAALFRAQVWSGDGPVPEDLAIKYGERRLIRSEAMRYDRHVGPLPDGVAAHLRWRRETGHLGALAYSWVGDSVEDGIPFGPTQGPDSMMTWRRRRNTLARLFSVSLNPWYRAYRSDGARIASSITLLDYYKGDDGYWRKKKEVPFLAGDLPPDLPNPVWVEGRNWDFGPYGELANPADWLVNSEFSRTRLTRYCPCHGDLHVKNIFVLPDDSPRLIDFGDTALGHVFRDFSSLEASIRMTCCNTTDLNVLKNAADCASAVGSLGDHINYRVVSGTNEDLREALKTIMLIRRAALDAVGDQPPLKTLKEYLYALVHRLLRYAAGIADEVPSGENKEQRAARIWHALYAAARASQQAEELTR